MRRSGYPAGRRSSRSSAVFTLSRKPPNHRFDRRRILPAPTRARSGGSDSRRESGPENGTRSRNAVKADTGLRRVARDRVPRGRSGSRREGRPRTPRSRSRPQAIRRQAQPLRRLRVACRGLPRLRIPWAGPPKSAAPEQRPGRGVATRRLRRWSRPPRALVNERLSRSGRRRLVRSRRSVGPRVASAGFVCRGRGRLPTRGGNAASACYARGGRDMFRRRLRPPPRRGGRQRIAASQGCGSRFSRRLDCCVSSDVSKTWATTCVASLAGSAGSRHSKGAGLPPRR